MFEASARLSLGLVGGIPNRLLARAVLVTPEDLMELARNSRIAGLCRQRRFLPGGIGRMSWKNYYSPWTEDLLPSPTTQTRDSTRRDHRLSSP
jgi:hypothetical protein